MYAFNTAGTSSYDGPATASTLLPADPTALAALVKWVERRPGAVLPDLHQPLPDDLCRGVDRYRLGRMSGEIGEQVIAG